MKAKILTPFQKPKFPEYRNPYPRGSVKFWIYCDSHYRKIDRWLKEANQVSRNQFILLLAWGTFWLTMATLMVIFG